MNSNQIFEEYTKASYKAKWIKEKADELGVYGSDIIAELLKSGYKFEELKRGNPGQYKAAMKKYEAWKKAGSPVDDDPDVLGQYKKQETEKTESTQVEKNTEQAEMQETISAELLTAVQSEKISELTCRAEKAERTLIEKVQEFQSAEQRYKEKIGILEKEMCELTQNYNEAMRMSAAVEKQNSDNEQYRAKYYELVEKYENLKKLHEIDAEDLESERELLTSLDKEIAEKDRRLKLAERFILDSIYEKIENPTKTQ